MFCGKEAKKKSMIHFWPVCQLHVKYRMFHAILIHHFLLVFTGFLFCVKGDFILHSSIENVKEALDSMLNLFLFKPWLCIETMYSKWSFFQLLQLLLSSKIVYFCLILPKNKFICSFVLVYAAKCSEATEKKSTICNVCPSQSLKVK